jgi:hypothetical protein
VRQTNRDGGARQRRQDGGACKIRTYSDSNKAAAIANNSLALLGGKTPFTTIGENCCDLKMANKF